jgi:hypothetical protein
MARPSSRELYQELRKTRFGFVPPGEHHLHEVYTAVKAHYPSLCDDSFLCAENCGSGHQRPEWQHVVRRALQAEKGPSGQVERSSKSRHWLFKSS